MNQEDEKIALITGSSRGIGRAVAMKLAEAGIFVYINYLQNEKAARQVRTEIKETGGKAELCPFDVADFEAAKKAVGNILEDKGRLDILVNNAGIVKDGLLARFKEAEWEGLIGTNLKGTFNCCHAVSMPMIKQRWGRIVNITSIAAEAGNAGQVAYSSAKAGILGFTKSLARELGKRNICVNAVSPGLIETDMIMSLAEKEKENIKKQIPLGRLGSPEDVANAVFFLVSPEAAYITGQIIRINGGLYM